MSSLSSKFSAAETCVFWDLDGCPIPTGLSPVSISANIRLALENMGYTGKMSISAYSAVKQNEEVEFESAQIKLIYKETSQEKGRTMYLDVMFWGIRHRNEPTNVMVILKDLSPRTSYGGGLVILKENDNNPLLAYPRNDPGVLHLRDTATSTWLWESLSTGGSPLDGHNMRPEPVTPPSPPCSACSRRALRLANKRKKRPTKPCLKRWKRSQVFRSKFWFLLAGL
ncbi:unnamed protein product [Microthlaspi erraticum]|uniref:NYN domain-containing protein n=1 Tax=Microthlaspi erraticum TaxID=1685480 RepID=A0A6D2LDH8_9BRAS|nr:unnamed protein product [Microthlaspi erraticum]